jgi:hypothetical protein
LKNPCIFKTVEILRQEENKTKIIFDNLKNGKFTKNVKRNSLRLKNIVENFELYEVDVYFDFLFGVIKFKFE